LVRRYRSSSSAASKPAPDTALLERVLAAPVAIRDRAGFEKKLARVSV
jgi:hypothetical protein